MSNNIVDLSGTLAITEVQSVSGRSQNSLVVQGWVETGPAWLGGRHAFIALDQKAKIILEYAREAGRTSHNIDRDKIVVYGVSAHGKLLPIGEKSALVIKHISFFDISNPVASCSMDEFCTNIVRMQGILSIPKSNPWATKIGSYAYPFQVGELLTEKTGENPGHRLIIPQEMAGYVMSDFCMRDKKAVEVSLVGSLRSLNETSFVKVKYLSLAS